MGIMLPNFQPFGYLPIPTVLKLNSSIKIILGDAKSGVSLNLNVLEVFNFGLEEEMSSSSMS